MGSALPQSLPLTGDLTVAEILGIAPVIAALDAIESGDASEEHFTTIGNDWDIEERTRAQLDRLGLGDLAFDRTLATLSGGQVASLGLAAQLLKRPDVLLLDEPTNNLDLGARRRLYDVLGDWKGCLLVVSHDERFLAEIKVERWLELSEGRLLETGRPAGERRAACPRSRTDAGHAAPGRCSGSLERRGNRRLCLDRDPVGQPKARRGMGRVADQEPAHRPASRVRRVTGVDPLHPDREMR
ncbi:ATP-binding cassette domain-containing protein [Nonomuraea sp. NPDC050536]|uniref:ATP-binding cassette domain-containing protein n=1 Tax=Nonomuraea sp. NPDC050536 TaxID=3364366 RepID=UPI0037CBCD6C